MTTVRPRWVWVTSFREFTTADSVDAVQVWYLRDTSSICVKCALQKGLQKMRFAKNKSDSGRKEMGRETCINKSGGEGERTTTNHIICKGRQDTFFAMKIASCTLSDGFAFRY